MGLLLTVALAVASVVPPALAQGSPANRAAARALQVQGPLPRAAVQEILERTLRVYRECVDARLSAGQRVAGEVHVRVHVEANGVPIAASVDWSNVGDRPLERCITRATEAWRLPEEATATVVRFRLALGEGAATGAARDVRGVIGGTERSDGHLPPDARNQAPATPTPATPRAIRRTLRLIEDEAQVRGGLSQATVLTVFRRRRVALRRCLTVTDTSAEPAGTWRLQLGLQVAPNGRVGEEPQVQLVGAPRGVIACVAATLRSTRFPRAGAETQIELRFDAPVQR